MATVSRQNEALLTDKITVQINRDDYFPAFDKAIKKYTKQAKIHGFRPGQVPVGVVKKMYGNGLLTDEILRTVEKEIKAYLDREKPAIFAQPLPAKENAETLRYLDVNAPGDYSFSFEIGLRPDFQLPNLKTATITRRKVEITPALLEEEISRLQNRYGNLKDLDTVESDQSVLNLIFSETDADGNEIEGGIKKDNSLVVSYFAEAVRPQLSSLVVGDSVVIKIGEAFEAPEKEWVISDLGLAEAEDANERSFRITITKIGLVEKRGFSEDFYEQIFPGKAITTEDGFKEAIKEELENYWLSQTKTQVHDEIFHYLIDHTHIEFPESFLKRWIQFGGEKPKSAEEADLEYPSFINSLQWELISNRIIDENQLGVTPEELKEYARLQILAQMGIKVIDENTAWANNYVESVLADRKFVDQTYHKLITGKIFSWAETQVTNYHDEFVSVEEFVSKQHHHHY
jgi:trigger factor